MSILLQLMLILIVALFLVPVTRWLKLPSALGYLLTGVVLGSSIFSLLPESDFVPDFLNLSILLFLFGLGLQMRPQRYLQMNANHWMMVTGLSLGSALVFTALSSVFLQQSLLISLILGLAGSTSSLVLTQQLLQRQQNEATTVGQHSTALLLIQALFAVVLIAITPLLGGVTSTEHGVAYFAAIIATFTALFLCNQYILSPIYHWLGKLNAQDMHVPVALLAVLSLITLIDLLGLPYFLGALFAGILLADSEFRPSLEHTLKPFQSLIIGLSFVALGLLIQPSDIIHIPWLIVGGALALVIVKFGLTLLLARFYQYSWRNSSLMASHMAQGGMFALIILSVAVSSALLDEKLLSPLLWMVGLSMLFNPLLYQLLDRVILPRLDEQNHLIAHLDTQAHAPAETPILLIGFGRFGQVIGRVLHQENIRFSVMDSNVEATELLNQYQIPFYQADATVATALEHAGIQHSKQVLVVLDDIEDSLTVVRHLCLNYPEIKLWVRARDRHHAHLLSELGVTRIWRETYASALELTQDLLNEYLDDANSSIQSFRQHDEQLLSRINTGFDTQHAPTRALAELDYLWHADLELKRKTTSKQQQNTNPQEIASTTDELS